MGVPLKFILTGGADSDKFEKIDNHFISLLGKKPTLLFIPLAGEEDSWDDGLDRIQEVFSTIEFDAIEMCVDLSVLEWDYIKNFSAIYIDGGNTFRLMEAIHNTHTFEILHRFLHSGGILNGDSAGAIVLGSHIQTAHFGEVGDKNESEVISYQGLGLIGKWAIHCHYKVDEDDEIERFSDTYGFPVIALHEETAIYIEDGILKVFGPGEAVIFKGYLKKTLKVGDVFQLI